MPDTVVWEPDIGSIGIDLRAPPRRSQCPMPARDLDLPGSNEGPLLMFITIFSSTIMDGA